MNETKRLQIILLFKIGNDTYYFPTPDYGYEYIKCEILKEYILLPSILSLIWENAIE